jgi:beta-alanine--pyruvate transaminase
MTKTTVIEKAGVASMEHNWLPFTPNRDFKEDPKLFSAAKGIYFYDQEGKQILDGSSGLFNMPAGHGRAEIATAVHNQILELDFTSSFLRGHEKAFLIADRLAEILPPSTGKLFFVNSGSEAIDTALKICLLYHRVRHEASRSIFVSRERAYHGSNFSGAALAGIANNRRAFGPPLLPVVHMRHTWTAEDRFHPGQPSHGAETAEDLLRLIELHGAENIAACVVEPIAGSTGVLVPPIGYLERLREICTKYGVLLVFDDVICGFGRTGKAFSAQSFGVVPDLITMAKAITNGVIPMGAVAVRNDIYDTIMDAPPSGAVEFFHGYTSSAHPVACAAALETMAIYERSNLFRKAEDLSSYFLDRIFTLEGVEGITDIRGYGMLAGIDIDPAITGMTGYALQKHLFNNGLHIKTTGNSAVIAPPFVCTQRDIDSIVDIIRDTLRSAGNQ